MGRGVPLRGSKQDKEDRVRDAYAKIFELFDLRERRRFALLVVLVMAMGLFDVLGVASVLPFLAVVSDPTTIERSEWLSWFRDLIGTQTNTGFMMVLGFTVFAFVLVTTIFRAATFYALTRFTKMRMVSVATRLMEVDRSQP